MSRVTRREWYRRVNAAWPETIPKLTADEAVRAARKLYRFVTRRTFNGEVRVTSGRRYTKVYGNLIIVNPGRGWHALVHSMSHWLEAYAGTHGHNAKHARLEIRMIKEVVRRGWLNGALRAEPKAATAAPTPIDVRARKRAQLEAAVVRWDRKRKRAENALRKLRRQLAAHARWDRRLATLDEIEHQQEASAA